MAGIMDYLDWRGDIPFAADPLNEVDSYILAKIGCPDFSGFIPGDAHSVDIRTAVDAYFAAYGQDGNFLGRLASESIGPMIHRLPDTVRFGDLRLSGFVKLLDPDATEQFSALTILLPTGSVYVSFRGTDDTLTGWKENLMMAVTDTIPAQTDALRYLTWAAEMYDGPLIVGGHSKGGNLAVYAAAMAEPAVRERITAVHNHDGPGFSPEFFASAGYQAIRPRLRTFLPQYSIVGMLLPREEDVTIVKSSRAGMAAHDGFQWEVLGPRFVRCEDFSRSTRVFEESMQTILRDMDMESRTEFIRELFDTLAATGALTITDITELHARRALELGRRIYRQPEVHKFVTRLIELMARDFAPHWDNPDDLTKSRRE